MRILIDARYLDGTFSGIGTYSRFLVEHLARIDSENQYYVVIHPGFKGNLALGPNFEVLSWRARPMSWKSYFRFHDLAAALRPDVLHALAPHAPIFHDGKMVLTVHDMQPFVDPDFSSRRIAPIRACYNLFYRWAYPTVIAKADWVVCDSYATRDEVRRILPGAASKLIVVHPGLKPEDAEPPTEGRIEAIRGKLNIQGPYLLYYGSTRPNKNLPNLVRAFARLVRDADEEADALKLVLVLRKDRFFKDVSRVISNRKIKHRVLIVDPLEPTEQQALLAGAHAFMFPSKFEGFGFPPLEAMRRKIPVLAGRSGSLPEILEDAALFVDPDDVEDIANGMRRLVEEEALRRKLVRRGTELQTRYDWMESAGFFHELYTKLLGPARREE